MSRRRAARRLLAWTRYLARYDMLSTPGFKRAAARYLGTARSLDALTKRASRVWRGPTTAQLIRDHEASRVAQIEKAQQRWSAVWDEAFAFARRVARGDAP